MRYIRISTIASDLTLLCRGNSCGRRLIYAGAAEVRKAAPRNPKNKPARPPYTPCKRRTPELSSRRRTIGTAPYTRAGHSHFEPQQPTAHLPSADRPLRIAPQQRTKRETPTAGRWRSEIGAPSSLPPARLGRHWTRSVDGCPKRTGGPHAAGVGGLRGNGGWWRRGVAAGAKYVPRRRIDSSQAGRIDVVWMSRVSARSRRRCFGRLSSPVDGRVHWRGQMAAVQRARNLGVKEFILNHHRRR